MRIPMRAGICLAFSAGWLGLAGLSLPAARAATAPEKVLPDATVFFVKVNDAAKLREAFQQSQYGQLWNDPAMKEFRDDLAEKVNESSKQLKDKLGVTYRELLELPQGAASLSLVGRDDPKAPVAFVITADAGNKADTMTDVMNKATKQAEESGSKVTVEKFKDAILHIVQPPKDKPKPAAESKAKTKKAKPKDQPEPPLVWTSQGSVFTIATDVDLVKDLLAHSTGREDSLAASEGYAKLAKTFEKGSHVVWYLDAVKLLRLMAQAGQAANPDANKGGAANTEALLQMMGLNSLKGIGGHFSLAMGSYDRVGKTRFLAPGQAQGLVKVFQFPKVALRPESWVPATVASYQTISWDLDAAYNAINDLANMFQPGMLSVLEQQLVGPNGGEPLSFKKDFFGPLGDRVTVISDFKKPIREDSQRMLVALPLEDTKAFQNTLTKVISLSNAKPKERDFQGTKIYDFEMPDLPNPNPNAGGNNVQLRGPISVAIAKDTVFASNEPTLLEQVLRGGGSKLAESAAYLSVAKQFPEKVSLMSFVRPDEQARLSFDMIKSGQFEKALQNAAAGGGPNLAKAFAKIDKEKLPPFEVFAKYLAPGGSFGETDEDGMTITSFTLRKEKP